MMFWRAAVLGLTMSALAAGGASPQRFNGGGLGGGAFRGPTNGGGFGHGGPALGGFGFPEIDLPAPAPLQTDPADDQPSPSHRRPRRAQPTDADESAPPKRDIHRRPLIVQAPPPRAPAPHPVTPVAPPRLAAAPLPDRARPPFGEVRYREGEVLVETAATIPAGVVAEALRRHRLVEVEATPLPLLGVTLRLWRIPDKRKAASVIIELASEAALARIQPNYLFALADEAAAAPALPQYALARMNVAPDLEDGAASVRVAIIDTALDDAHPDLAGAVEARFDALGDKVVTRDHGTAMAGGVAARGRLRGVATKVKLLAARAFDSNGAGGALGSTLSIVKSLDWAAAQKAQVVNMSFAGPDDPILRDALAAASARGMALVSAAGNLGPSAPPQYPGADAHVIAATATDAEDKRFVGANVGAYVAVSAPGVDVLLPAPNGGYAMETGTSVSSALVAGVVALMLERNPSLKPDDLRARLAASAKPLGARNEFGAGLVDAQKAAR